MPAINPNSPATGGQPAGTDLKPLDADPEDVENFQKALENQSAPSRTGGFFDDFVVDPNKSSSFFDDFTVNPSPVEPKKSEEIDIENYEPEKPEPPKPEEKKSSFWSDLKNGVDKGVKSVVDFLGKPEVAMFMRAANIVFAGAMVVAAGVMFATGVGAPAAVAALALAGAAGLVMQLPMVHDTLQAGVTALMSPVLGQENAEKLGPLVTQGMISALMITIVATGGQAGSAKGALDAAVGVFSTMKDVFSGIGQVLQAGGPLLELAGINVDSKSILNMGSMFGIMASMMPDLSKFAEGLGGTLKDFLAKPDMDAFAKFLGTMTDIPESLAKLIDSNFLKGMGALLEGGEKFIAEFQSNDLLNNITGLLQLLSQGANLAKA